jgi:Undecaprenyl-phosphate glucose phosphotransferase
VLPFAVATGLAAWLLSGFELYRFGRSERIEAHLGKLSAALGLSLFAAWAVAAFEGVSAGVRSSGLVWCAFGVLALQMLHAWWWGMVQRWRDNGRLTPNIVVVGATRHAERLIRAAIARRDVNVIGVFDDRLARAPEALAGVPVLGDTAALLEHRIAPYVDRVVVAVDPSAKSRVREIVNRLKVLPNEVSLMVDLETETDCDAALTKLADAPLTRLSGAPEDEKRAFAKRCQDLVIGAAALVLLAPLMAAIAVWIKLDSRGPVFFRQKRHGFNNETITVWKFRSMRHEAADHAGERQVSAEDDRVTRAGRFLRRTSLDELPQLFNVLAGSMSLVGPRPHAAHMKTGQVQSSRLVAEYAWRCRIKPGMTGWAAIKGSRGPLDNPAEVRRRVALDIDYIERQSLWLDLWILALTVPCLLGDRQAVR